MNSIVGRIPEKKELEEAYGSNNAEFIAVYGRRRVGKTYLIKNFFQVKKCIYFQSTGIYKGPIKKQLARFSKELGTSFYDGASMMTPANWMDAFEALTDAITQVPKNKKIVLFLDELPWMATRKSGILSALEYFWNRYWTNDSRIKLIVCGSAASWIIKKIIKNRGGLHNRVTCKIKLFPFNLSETFLYLKHINYSCNYQQAARLYMMVGGVPFYLKNIKKNLSIDQNIDNLFFNSSGILFDEFDEVFSSLFEHSDQYKEIVTIITANQDGVSRSIIKEKNKLTGKGGRLTKRLEDLENAGFIITFMPYGNKKKGIYYKISDEYCCFYLKWIEPIKSQLKQNQITTYWESFINTPEYFGWLGYVFENICYKHLRQIKSALGLQQTSLASPWRYTPKKGTEEQGTQIDLLFDRNDGAITICELKYTEQPFIIDKQYAAKLKQKMEVFRKTTHTKKQLFLAMVSARGLKENMYSEEYVHEVVKLEDLFKREE